MPYLTNEEENELKRLKTTTDEGILSDEDLLDRKWHEKLFYCVLGRRGGGKMRIQIRGFLKLWHRSP